MTLMASRHLNILRKDYENPPADIRVICILIRACPRVCYLIEVKPKHVFDPYTVYDTAAPLESGRNEPNLSPDCHCRSRI